MKVAISMHHEKLSSHLGSSTSFVVLKMDEGKIKEKKVVKSPGFHRNIPLFLDLEGIDFIVTKDMCSRAVILFKEMGITKVLCVRDNLDDVIQHLMKKGSSLEKDLFAK